MDRSANLQQPSDTHEKKALQRKNGAKSTAAAKPPIRLQRP
jgi:hypothetical protein